MAKKIEFDIDFKTNGKEIMGSLAIDSKQLADAVASVNKQAADFRKNMNEWGFMAQAFDQAVGIFGQLESVVGSVTAQYESFDQSMRAANTMAGKSGKEFNALKEEIKDLSKVVPVARDELANGLYQVISNGVPEDNWMEFLEKSARSSVGGLADLGQTVTVTSTILKNYAYDWSKAGEIQDKIQLTAKNGVTSFGALAAALPRVSGNASILDVSIDELMASFATLTGVSGNTAEVSTQLAAIFTALIKPSSEAQKTAAAMGIQFDAAAIKAAGGFQNFLTKLKESVSAYAAASGELEQSVMAKLFGSAESLRALGPLMGNLSDKFNENISSMVDSAGTMDVAFAEMSNTAEAQRTLWQNMYAAIMDNVAGIAQWTKSALYWTTTLANGCASMYKLYTLVKTFNIATTASATKIRILSLGISAYGVMTGRTAATQRLLNGAMAQGAISGTALSVAIRGILISTGVGVAVLALTAIISKFIDTAEDIPDVVDDVNDAQEEYIRVAADAKVKIDNEAKALHLLMGSTNDTTGAVNRLNREYGAIFGNHKTAAEWYDVLTKKSAAYAQMLGYEAQIRMLSAKNAEHQLRLDESVRNQSDWMKENRDKWHERRDPDGGSYYTSNDKEFQRYENEQKTLANQIEKNNAKLTDARNHMDEIMREYKIKIPAPVVEDIIIPETPDLDKDKKSKNASKITSSKDKGKENPTELKTVEDFNKRIAFLENEKLTATQERCKQIDAEIAYTKQLLEIWQGKRKSEDTSAEYIRMYDDELKAATKYGDTLKGIADEVSKLEAIKENASANEIADIQRAIDARKKQEEQLEKIASIPSLVEKLPSIMDETMGLSGLSGIELKIRLQSIGADKIESQIGELSQMIDALNAKMSLEGMGADGYSKDKEQREELRAKRDELKKYLDTLQEAKPTITDAVSEIGGSLSGLGNELQLPELNVAGTMAQAIATMVEAYATASLQASKYGPIAWAAFAASGLAQLTAIVASVKSLPAFATGGIVGGSSPTGDKLLARVNSGEMILNLTQQKRLFEMLNASSGIRGVSVQPPQAAEITLSPNMMKALLPSPSSGETVRFEIKGRTLVGILEKEKNINYRS